MIQMHLLIFYHLVYYDSIHLSGNFDLTEENLQSRARAIVLMGISNKFGPMVVTTGNKSEMAVGYATLYGDMCGGFNPIKDIYKSKLSKLKNLRVLDTLDKNLTNSYWLCTVLCEKRLLLQKELRKFNIETNQVHFRNDRYSIFKNFIKNKKFPNMDLIEKKYLVLPVHTKMTIVDAHYVANTVNKILSS